jgi:hypothetical protein
MSLLSRSQEVLRGPRDGQDVRNVNDGLAQATNQRRRDPMGSCGVSWLPSEDVLVKVLDDRLG